MITQRRRLGIAVAAGGYGSLLAWMFASRPGFLGDHLAWWFAARVLLGGGNPYETLPNGAPYFIHDPFMYPLTAAVGATPFAMVPLPLSHALFVGVGSALMAWALAPRGWHLLLVFLSFPFVMAANLGQWSPYLVAAMLVPALGWMVALKPNLGLAAVAYRPGVSTIVGGGVFALLTLVVMPAWPWEWLASIKGGAPHPAPLFTMYGAPVALAALRWRHPEARLLLAMSALPQTSMFADQLPLFLVPRSRKELMVLVLTSGIGGILYAVALREATGRALLVDIRYVTLAMYLPALVMVLRRPSLPDSVEASDRAGDEAAVVRESATAM